MKGATFKVFFGVITLCIAGSAFAQNNPECISHGGAIYTSIQMPLDQTPGKQNTTTIRTGSHESGNLSFETTRHVQVSISPEPKIGPNQEVKWEATIRPTSISTPGTRQIASVKSIYTSYFRVPGKKAGASIGECGDQTQFTKQEKCELKEEHNCGGWHTYGKRTGIRVMSFEVVSIYLQLPKTFVCENDSIIPKFSTKFPVNGGQLDWITPWGTYKGMQPPPAAYRPEWDGMSIIAKFSIGGVSYSDTAIIDGSYYRSDNSQSLLWNCAYGPTCNWVNHVQSIIDSRKISLLNFLEQHAHWHPENCLPKQDTPTLEAGKGTPQAGPVLLSLSLGKISPWQSAGTIELTSEGVLDSGLSINALRCNPNPGVSLSKDSNGVLKQIITPYQHIELVDGEGSFEVRFFNRGKHPSEIAGKSQSHPQIIWRLTAKNKFEFTLEKIQNNRNTAFTYRYIERSNMWVLKSGSGLLEDQYQIFEKPDGKTVERRWALQSENDIKKVVRKYKVLPGDKEVLVEQIENPLEKPQVTKILYNENPSDKNRYGKIAAIQFPNGIWRKFSYDTSGRLILILSNWKEVPFGEAHEGNAHSLKFEYHPLINPDRPEKTLPHLPRTITETIEGIPIAKSYFTYVHDGRYLTKTEEACSNPYNQFGHPDNLITKTIIFQGGILAGQVKEVHLPNGLIEEYHHGMLPIPAAISPSMKYIGFRVSQQIPTKKREGLPGKTLQKIETFNEFGQKILERRQILALPNTYFPLDTTSYFYTNEGAIATIKYPNGTVAKFKYLDGLLVEKTDSLGQKFAYEYNELEQLIQEIQMGIMPSDHFPGVPDCAINRASTKKDPKISFSHEIPQSIKPTDFCDPNDFLSLESSMVQLSHSFPHKPLKYNSLPIESSDFSLSSWASGNSKVRNMLPNSPSEITCEVNRAGQLIWTEILNDNQLIVKTFTNALGQVVRKEKKVSSHIEFSENEFDKRGFLIKHKPFNGYTSLFQYNESGELIRWGLDRDGDNLLLNNSADLIFEQEHQAIQDSLGHWFFTLKQWSHPKDDDSSKVLVSETNQRMNGFSNELIAEVSVKNFRGGEERFTVQADSASGTLLKHHFKNETAYEVSHWLGNLPLAKNHIGFEYDALHRRIAIYANGQLKSKFSYDASNHLIGIEDPSGNRTLINYATNGRIQEVSNSFGEKLHWDFGKENHTQTLYLNADKIFTLERDTGSRSVSYVNHSEVRISITRNALGQISGIRNPMNQEATLTYNSSGQLHTLLNPRMHSLVWKNHHPEGPIMLIFPTQDTIRFAYNRLGLLSEKTNPNGDLKRYEYDLAGQVTEIRYKEGNVFFTYNSLGQPTGILGPSTKLGLQYDSNCKLIRITDSLLKETITYEYDDQNRRKALNQKNFSITYSYDLLDRITAIQSNREKLPTRIRYDVIGKPIATKYPNGMVVESKTSALGRPMAFKITGPLGHLLAKGDYMYHDNGLLSRIQLEIGAHLSAISYEYDVVGRITSEKHTLKNGELMHDEQFEYDANGNILRHQRNGTIAYRQYNEGDQLIKETTHLKDNSRIHRVFGYDKNGNLIGWRNNKDEQVTMRYDALNRLTYWTDGTRNELFGYCGTSMLISSMTTFDRQNRQTRGFLYDGTTLLAELEHDKTTTKVNKRFQIVANGEGTICYDEQQKEVSYTIIDPSRKIQIQIDASGIVNGFLVETSLGVPLVGLPFPESNPPLDLRGHLPRPHSGFYQATSGIVWPEVGVHLSRCPVVNFENFNPYAVHSGDSWTDFQSTIDAFAPQLSLFENPFELKNNSGILNSMFFPTEFEGFDKLREAINFPLFFEP
jgi:YD repeat-containing protein